jgi:hypothetical protein
MAKLQTAIGFHMAVPSYADGIGDYWRKLARNGHAIVAKGVRSGGPSYQVQELAKQFDIQADGIWRLDQLEGRHSDVPVYGANITQEAEFYWNEVDRQFPPELDKDFAWVEFPNEVDKHQSKWLGKWAVECARIARERGYKWLCPGWSGGEPEPGHWLYWLDYLRICEQEPERFGISVHEYTFRDDEPLLAHSPHLIGRVTWLNNACLENHIKPPTVFISEFGYGSTSAPHASFAVPDIIQTVDWYIEHAPNVRGILIWALDRSSEWSNLDEIVNSYITPMGEAICTREWQAKDVAPPPPPPPPEPGDLMVRNPNFGDRNWSDITGTKQEPAEWKLDFTRVGEFLPSGRIKASTTSETVHRFVIPTPPDTKPTLPEQEGYGMASEGHTWDSERDGLVLVNPNVLKTFGTGSWADTLYQTIDVGSTLAWERFKVYAYVDVHWHGYPPGDNPPEQEDIVVQLTCGEQIKEYTSHQFPDRTWHRLECVGQADENGKLFIALNVEAYWAHPRSVFIGGFELEHLSVTPPPPPPPPPPVGYKAVVFKSAQEHTRDEYVEICRRASDEYGRDVTRSHDSLSTLLEHGNDESYAVIWDAYLPSQIATCNHLDNLGLKWIGRALRPPPTDWLEGLEFSYLFYSPYTMTSVLDEDRSYGLHLDDIQVAVGQHVLAGQPLGELGSTGNSSAEHVHVTMQVPGKGMSGYVVPDVVNPEQFFPHPHLKYLVINPSFPTYDMADYMVGDGRKYVVRTIRGAHEGSEETFQCQTDEHGAYLVKNQQFEYMVVTDTHIRRGLDTSPDGTNFYVQFLPGDKTAPWAKRHMKIGERFDAPTSHRVEFYTKDGCLPSRPENSGWASNGVTLVAHWDFIRGIEDVIELVTNTGETMFFARGYGLVGWRSPWGESWFKQMSDNQDPLQRESGCFDSWLV